MASNRTAATLADSTVAQPDAPLTEAPPSRRSRRMLQRLLGFGVLPIASLVGSLLLIPLLTRTAGPEGWASIATGQALGVAVATFVQFGWLTVGPPKVALADLQEARGVYFTSALMRGGILLLCLPVLIALTWSLVDHRWFGVAAAIAASVALSGMSSSWFYVGRGSPRGLLALEVGPRLASTALSAAVLAAGADVAVYAAIALTGECAIAAAVLAVNARRTASFRVHLRAAASALREQWGLALSALLGLGYQRAAVPIVAGASFAAAPLYAVADRCQAYARLPFVPIAQALQQWVYEGGPGSADPTEYRRRARRATALVVAASAVVAVLLIVVLPLASGIFFGPELALSTATTLPVSVSVVAVGVSLALTTFVLVPSGHVRVITWSGIAASLVSAPSVWFATIGGGTAGALWVIAGAEMAVAVVQAVPAFRLLRD